MPQPIKKYRIWRLKEDGTRDFPMPEFYRGINPQLTIAGMLTQTGGDDPDRWEAELVPSKNMKPKKK